mgnify:CR=1 FL=1
MTQQTYELSPSDSTTRSPDVPPGSGASIGNPYDEGLIAIARLTATIQDIRLPFRPYEGALMSSPEITLRLVLASPGLRSDLVEKLEAIRRTGNTVRVIFETRTKGA